VIRNFNFNFSSCFSFSLLWICFEICDDSAIFELNEDKFFRVPETFITACVWDLGKCFSTGGLRSSLADLNIFLVDRQIFLILVKIQIHAQIISKNDK
jgi:hypothetical protein